MHKKAAKSQGRLSLFLFLALRRKRHARAAPWRKFFSKFLPFSFAFCVISITFAKIFKKKEL